MKIKVSETTRIQLDWLVAQLEGVRFSSHASSVHYYSPTRVWSQGGPILEREQINLNIKGTWEATMVCPGKSYREFGPTMLIAGLRCYVASKLGDAVEIPEELS